MTVQELINELSYFDPEQEVVISHISGDHWSTEIAVEPTDFEEKHICYSSYHRKYMVLDREPDEEQDEKVRLVIVIS